jgi:citrate synthase
MSDTLSAKEAAQVLGVSLATLYSYVSRGLLQSGEAGSTRRKRYPRDAVMRLAARNADGKRAGHKVVASMQWGLPVMETRISRIADGQLHYRGHPAVALSKWASLEQAALILWGRPDGPYFEPAMQPECELNAELNAELGAHWTRDMSRLVGAQALLPLLAHSLPTVAQSPEQLFAQSALLMRMLAALLLQTPLSHQPLHLQLAQHWGLDGPATEVVRASLVLMADHEFNTSTFTVRCVASCGSGLAMALSAGLAALAGPHHGGSGPKIRDAIAHGLDTWGAATAPVHEELVRLAADAGFGHPLYPQGDPRAATLLDALGSGAAVPSVATRCRRIVEMGQAAGQVIGAAPNADYALAAIEVAYNLPRDACQILFALARSAGWMAHAIEQIESGQFIRPRARYVGNFAPED